MTDLGFTVDTRQGELIIGDDFSTCTPAYFIEDLSPLWGQADLRGANITLPGAAGRRALPRRTDETTYPLVMHITGAVDPDGVPYDDPVMGLVTNLDLLIAAFLPSDPPATTHAASLTMPDSSIRTADVQLVFAPGALLGPYDKSAGLFVTIPGPPNRFVESGS